MLRSFIRGILTAPIFVGLMIAAAATMAVPVPAQEVAAIQEPSGSVLLAPLITTAIPYLAEAILTGFFVLASLLAAWVKSKWNIDATDKLKSIEAKHRDAMHSAIKTAAGNLIAKHGIGNGLEINVGSEDLAYILRHLRDSVPDAIEYFHPSNEVVAKIATAKVTEIAAPALMNLQAATFPAPRL